MDIQKLRFALNLTLKNEGGYSANPSDAGGETKYGISKRSYPGLDIKNLTRPQAEEILLRDFWAPNRYEFIKDWPLAAKVFDLAVLCGPKTVNKWLQQICNEYEAGLKMDGVMGPFTLDEINQRAPSLLMLRLLATAHDHFFKVAQRGTNGGFFKGWINRLFAI